MCNLRHIWASAVVVRMTAFYVYCLYLNMCLSQNVFKCVQKITLQYFIEATLILLPSWHLPHFRRGSSI